MAHGVLIVSPFYEPNIGGVETHLSDLVSYLAKRGYRVWVLTYQPISTRASAASVERYGNLEVHRIEWIRGPRIYHALEPFYPALYCYLTPGLLFHALLFLYRFSDQIDVVHAHGLIAASVGVLAKALFGKRLVVSLHSLFDFSSSPVLARTAYGVLKQADLVLGLSNRSVEELLSIGLDRARVSKFTYWVDIVAFSPRSRAGCRRELGFDEKFTVLFVGRLIPVKGIHLLIEIAEYLPGVTFLIIGSGPLLETIRNASRRLPGIKVVGKVKNSDLPTYYNAADLVVMPSVYEEGFGRVLLEALACGTPVIASRRGGIVEAVDESVAALVEPTAEYFVQAIESLMGNSVRLMYMRDRARLFAEVHYSIANAEIFESAYGFKD